MRHVYAPFIGRVVSQARRRLDGAPDTDVVGAARRALDDLSRTRAFYQALEPAVLRTSESATRALHDVETCFGLVSSALVQVEEAGRAAPPPSSPVPGDEKEVREPLLAGALDALEGAVSELWRALDVLGSIQAGEETYSPFPTINLAIKVGMNVLDGHLPAAGLEPWEARIDAVVATLVQRGNRFEALHADRPDTLGQALAALVDDMIAGAGALHTFRAEGDRTALVDGLRLLRHASEGLAATLEEMDRFVRQSARWSTMPAVEDFCRAAWEAPGSELLDDAAASLDHFLRFLEGQVQGLRALPLAYTIAEQTDAFGAAVDDARASFEAVRRSAADQERLTLLQDGIANARRCRDDCLAALEREMDAVSLSPHLEELKELAGRYLQGAASEALLRERVIAWLKAHALLEMQLRDTAKAALGSDAAELLALLHQQGEGIEEATRFFRNGDVTHLVNGFHRMEAPLAGLADIRERVVRSLQRKTGAPAMMPCFKCGAPNEPGRTHCKACGVLLPAIARAVAPAAVTEEGAGEPLPRNIARLERIVEAYEQGKASAADIQYECGLFLGRLGHIRRDFERRFVPRLRAERSPSLINMARDFYENLTDLQSGLHEMLAFGDHGRPDGLYRGLSECVESGRAMRSSQSRIEEVLGDL